MGARLGLRGSLLCKRGLSGGPSLRADGGVICALRRRAGTGTLGRIGVTRGGMLAWSEELLHCLVHLDLLNRAAVLGR